MLRQSVLTGLLALMMVGQQQGLPDGPSAQKQTVPDAPTPQIVPELANVAPGKSTTPESNNDPAKPGSVPATDKSAAQEPGSSSTAGPDGSAVKTPDVGPPPVVPATGQGAQTFGGEKPTFVVSTNFVEVPFVVKDKQGNMVPGLTWRDIIVRENGVQQRMSLFTEDPFPISAAVVIDQSLPQSVMEKVNTALGALQGAFTGSDELAIITYNNGPRAENGGKFSAAPSANITALLEKAKGPGRPMGVPINDGPMAGCDRINETDCFDNNTTMHPGQSGTFLTIPKEVHTLNDAVFMAAEAVSKRANGRRRIVYVISDGKENGSKLGFNEVKRYLLMQKVTVYATVVGDSAIWGLGFLDRMSLPYQMKDNILPKYVLATGGDIVSEFREANIQGSFAKVAGEVRNQYTLGYISHEPFIDGKYRSIEVLVKRPGLTVIARPGYYPTAADLKAH